VKVEFSNCGWEDLNYWINQDVKVAKKILKLLKDIKRNPFEGLGKPEPLKYDFAGFWSRRIDQEHRLVYRVEGKSVSERRCVVVQCRFHY